MYGIKGFFDMNVSDSRIGYKLDLLQDTHIYNTVDTIFSRYRERNIESKNDSEHYENDSREKQIEIQKRAQRMTKCST